MPVKFNEKDPAIVRGIKTVGVGKKGSKALTAELALEIKADLDAGNIPAASQGAFFAGLLHKGVEPIEAMLVPDPTVIVNSITHDAPDFVKWVCHQLRDGKTLDKATAYDLGKFLFSNETGDGARGMIASFLRVRYETDDEYEGILKAMQETIEPSFLDRAPSGQPIVQIAEPFDGNDHSYIITPLVGEYVQSLGYRVMHMVGRNSGPKLILNLHDVMQHLECTVAMRNQDLGNVKPTYGWFYDQALVSRPMDQWVNIRRQTIKRPFLATLEKFINPACADIIVTSAFHPPYGEKMLTIAERARYKGIMVIRNGIEGSCGMPLKRPAKLLLSALQHDGTYARHEISFDVEDFLKESPATEEQREILTAEENALLIREHLRLGKSVDPWFQLRVKATQEAFRLGLEYLKGAVYGMG